MAGIRYVLLGLVVSMVILSSFQESKSVLWDLLIYMSFEKNPIHKSENPVIFGYIVDHAGKAVSNATVTIRLDKESQMIITNSSGYFKNEFSMVSTPGYYSINVMATTEDGRIGLASENLHVLGELSVSTQSAYDLDLMNSTYFEKIKQVEGQKDPLSLTLYNYYIELQTKLAEEESKQKEIDEYQQFVQHQRNLSNQLFQQILQEENPGAGTYSGWRYDRFVDNLDLSVREIIVNQLNYTLNSFYEAQIAMDEVLENGGTFEEARQAYYSKVAVSRDMMEKMTVLNQPLTSEFEGLGNFTDNTILVNENYNFSNTLIESLENEMVYSNATVIQLSENVKTLYVNINGTIIQLFVNGTEIYQVENSVKDQTS